MANLRDIRKRRRSASNTRKITRTMELVASAKLKKAQEAAAASRPYADGLRQLLERLQNGGPAAHPLMAVRPVKRALVVLCSSDRGLCGSFNANLAQVAMGLVRQHRRDGCEVEILALGKKGGSTLSFLGQPPTAMKQKLVGGPYALCQATADELIARFLAGGIDRVEVVYARFISTVKQQPDHLVLLPAGAGAGADAKAKGQRGGDPIFTPSQEEVLDRLVPQTVRSALFSALLQTAAAEHAARRIAMKNATDAAGDMVRVLTTVYNRGRQGKITQEIAEITGAVEAMA